MNNASLYEKIHPLMASRITREVLREFAPRLRWRGAGGTGEAVLDVGSGTGLVTRSMLLPLLPARVRTVVGADLAPEMVRHARTAHAHADPRLRFVQADIAGADCVPRLRAEAGAGTFSAIFSFLCLQWVQDQRTAMKNIYDLLHPHGECLLVSLTQGPLIGHFEDLTKLCKWRPYLANAPTHSCPYKLSADPGRDLSHLLSDVGFQIIECRWDQKCLEVDDMEGLKDHLVSVNPYFERIPGAEHEEFKEDILQAFLKRDEIGEYVCEGHKRARGERFRQRLQYQCARQNRTEEFKF